MTDAARHSRWSQYALPLERHGFSPPDHGGHFLCSLVSRSLDAFRSRGTAGGPLLTRNEDQWIRCTIDVGMLFPAPFNFRLCASKKKTFKRSDYAASDV